MSGYNRCSSDNNIRMAGLREQSKHYVENQCCEHDNCSCGGHSEHDHSKKSKIILFIRVIVSIIFLLLSLIKYNFIHHAFIILSYVVISYDILFNALKNILKGKLFDENFLMSLASLTAMISYLVDKNIPIDAYDGVLVMILYQLGEFIQHFAVDKSKESISKMMELDVKSIIRINNGKEEVIDVKDIQINDILLVKPGDKIVVDGIVIEGSSSINTSSLTGESKPLDVYENDKVLSGCINEDGVMKIKATSTFDDSTTAKVKKVVEAAAKSKAKHEKIINKFAKVYTPIVLAISLIIAFVIPLILGFDEYFTICLYKALSILVVSCPCALVISIPLSYFMGIGKCAKYAILVKGSNYLEILSSVDEIAFDKTGTLTKGNFIVNEYKSSNGKLMNSLLYSCEKNFTHVIATSITKYLKDKAEEVELETIKNLPGYGVIATYRGKQVLIGNKKLMEKYGIAVNEIYGESVVYVAFNKELLGYISISDELKDDALSAINELNKKYKVSIVSGDKKESVVKTASLLSIDSYYYEMLPEDKLKVVDNIVKNKTLLYVGDGINDAACLIKSSCGIAMRSLGSDMAIKASDIVIMNDNVSSVNKAISISKKTVKIVKQNIAFSIVVKVIIMILSMIFMVPMWCAILGDVGVCLLAILNSLRIMYGKTK